MPTTTVVDEQKILEVGLLIGFACLIYNFRKKLFHPTKHDYKILLECIGELLFAKGLRREFRDIEDLFLNYDNDLDLQHRIVGLYQATDMIGEEATSIKILHNFFNDHPINKSNLNFLTAEPAPSLPALLIVDVYRCILSFEYCMPTFYKASVICLKRMEPFCFTEHLAFEKLWYPVLIFLARGFKFFPEELHYSLDGFKDLTLDLYEISGAREVCYNRIKEALIEVKTLNNIEIRNFNFTSCHNNILLDLKLLLKPLVSIFSLNVHVAQDLHNSFEIVDLCFLQAHIQSMSNVHNNNIINDYWDLFLKLSDSIIVDKHWLEYLEQKTLQYCMALKMQNDIWMTLREQIIHGGSQYLPASSCLTKGSQSRQLLMLEDDNASVKNADKKTNSQSSLNRNVYS